MPLERVIYKVPKDTMHAVQELANAHPDWVDQTIFLAGLVEKGEVYRQIGSSYERISLNDVGFLPKASYRDFKAENLGIAIDKEAYPSLFRPGHRNLNEWMNLAVALRLRADVLELRRKTPQGYEEIVYPTYAEQAPEEKLEEAHLD